jgi:hypothetical protein
MSLAKPSNKERSSSQVRLLPAQAWLPRPPLSRRKSDTSDRKWFHRIPPTHRTIPKKGYEALNELPTGVNERPREFNPSTRESVLRFPSVCLLPAYSQTLARFDDLHRICDATWHARAQSEPIFKRRALNNRSGFIPNVF